MRSREAQQIARLEEEARLYLQRMRAQEKIDRDKLRNAVGHAVALAFILRCGKPRIDEPLWRACERCERSDVWKKSCEIFPTTFGEIDYEFRPHQSRLFKAVEALRYSVDSFFPGTNEKDKLSRVFRSAPPWFVWFTFADRTAKLLGLPIPDLSSVSRFQRAHKILAPWEWYRVPEGKFERRLWENGIVQEPPACISVVRSEAEEACLTFRDRKRALRQQTDRSSHKAIMWPQRFPIEYLELTLEEHRAILRSPSTQAGLSAILERKYPEKYARKRRR